MKQILLLVLVVCFLNVVFASDAKLEKNTWDKWSEHFPGWVKPIEPFRIIGNIYYVGTEGIGSFLITSEQGHVLIDGTLPQSASLIEHNIKTLGFKLEDVKTLLNSHAHFDHSGGLAQLKKNTGARMVASQQDKPYLESGKYPGSNNPSYSSPKVTVDQEIVDGELIKQGPIQLMANITPGTRQVVHLGL